MGLFDFINRIPSRHELKGSVGEWMTRQYSKHYIDALILHDILIEGAEGYTSQIDMLMIGSKGIYVVEVKFYEDAKVYGDGKKSKWYYYNHGKKYEIYSPLKQNQKHIAYLKSFLKDFGDVPCFSVLAIICDDFKVSNINPEGKLETVVCSSWPAMHKGVQLIADNHPAVLDDEKKKQIFEYISKHQITGKDARFQHKQNVREYKANLEEMKQQKICPYCKVPLVQRQGKYGAFYGCPNYPKCKYTMK